MIPRCSPCDIETALDLTPLFYPAAIDFERWPEVLRELNAIFGTVIAQVTLANFRTKDLIATAHCGLTPEMLEAWLGLPGHLDLDPRVAYAMRMRNRPFCEREVMPLDEWHGSRFYKLLMERFELDSVIGALTDIDEERGIFAGLKVIRRAADPPFDAEDIARFHLYLPHFREAMRCAARVRQAEARANVFSNIFDRLRIATLVTDRFAAVRYTNASAEALLCNGNGIVPSRGNLMAMTGEATARLHRAILTVLAGGADGGGKGRGTGSGSVQASTSLVRLPRPGLASDLLVSIAPVGGRGFDRVGHQMLAVLFVLDPERRYEGDGEALQRLFGLTDSEVNVALGIAQGHSARDIAAMQGRAYETVRSHLKAVYDKTGARSRTDLCGIVNALVIP